MKLINLKVNKGASLSFLAILASARALKLLSEKGDFAVAEYEFLDELPRHASCKERTRRPPPPGLGASTLGGGP